MAVYLITYDLNSPGQDYTKVYDEIKSFGSWAHYMESVWFVDTSYSATTMRDRLKSKIDSNDTVLISKVTEYSGWAPQKMWDWLNSRV
ncbi:hypothetical protein ACFSTA_12435 [Ornithinibacillus salinisoli]|uniref:SinR family protein n=1 Tax=Ornithinibacillus salinisoli TaxID=1848459 RepID=A0ABW4W2L0_9BACI